MNQQSIRIFLSIVENKSISGAARDLRLAQQTVSEHLNQLEKQLGVQLVVRARGARQTALTPPGEAFVALARMWMELEGEVESFISAQKKRVLRLAASAHAQGSLLPSIVPGLLLRDPELEIRLATLEFREMEKAVKARSFDAALCFGGPVMSESNRSLLVKIPLFEEERYVICPVDTPLPDRVLTPEDLDPSREVDHSVFRQNGVMTKWREKHFPAGVKPYFLSSNISAIPDYLLAPECWAMLPASIVERRVEQAPERFTYRRCRPAPPPRRCCLFVTKAYADGEAIKNLLDCFAEYLAERPYMQRLFP